MASVPPSRNPELFRGMNGLKERRTIFKVSFVFPFRLQQNEAWGRRAAEKSLIVQYKQYY
jgi:hypothetical protein